MILIPKETAVWIPLTIQTSNDELLNVTRASGEYLFDEKGEAYVDGVASWWTSIHGHCHPKIISAITKQASQLDHMMLAGMIHAPAESLAKKILLLAEGDFNKVYYSDNGSNAVEIALKIAVQFFKNNGNESESKKESFITFSASYHGDSIGAMNVSGLTYFNRIFSALRFPTKEFIAPNCKSCPFLKKPETCGVECLDSLEEELKENASQYAGVIIEPLVFGAGGMIFFETKVLIRLEFLCHSYNILLILDEVFTGMGRTGKAFAYQLANIKPDLVAMAKGLTGGSLPLAATLVSKRIYESFLSEDPYASFFHAHTMTGNPIACAAGIASIDLLISDGYDSVSKLKLQLEDFIFRLAKQFPEKIKNPRVLGAIGAFEWEEPIADDEYLNPIGKRLKQELLKHKVLLRPLGSTVYITPPYNIGARALEQIYDALQEAFRLL
ncbi:adenosylmethionine--8-amino-7-oxononanoate transaminase [Leptospira ognonensis]|uniref:Adenosylmethionine-8-amino-7-oxononanoate aminotransferase n=1 Tax=Leptospira ognonensis TaxID=2484945 RepID=A0A4R9JXA7_9LEPT|nr:adenosylmethionine--8-amino-7-oxononanoate transaminase [Leptospira ognonensis]TGL57102.1 adenosylmethionine--8-amino-7-oxononanoate transaminase [Leptospira ognonensis]